MPETMWKFVSQPPYCFTPSCVTLADIRETAAARARLFALAARAHLLPAQFQRQPRRGGRHAGSARVQPPDGARFRRLLRAHQAPGGAGREERCRAGAFVSVGRSHGARGLKCVECHSFFIGKLKSQISGRLPGR